MHYYCVLNYTIKDASYIRTGLEKDTTSDHKGDSDQNFTGHLLQLGLSYGIVATQLGLLRRKMH